MEVYLSIGQDGRVMSSSTQSLSENDVRLLLPDDHEVFDNPFIYKYFNGELFKDEEYQQFLIDKQQERLNAPTIDDQISTLISENEKIRSENEQLKHQLNSTNADLMGFMDFYFNGGSM